MKAIVVYTSKYGSAEQYARWVAEALGCPARRLADVSAQTLADHDTIIYGGGIYAGGIAGFKKFLAKLGSAEGKTLALFMVGITNPERTDYYDRVADQNIPAGWRGRFAVFALRGDQLFSKMSGLHKLMMRMPKMMAEKKPPKARTEEDRGFTENYGRDVVFSAREQTAPLLDHLRGGHNGGSKVTNC